MWRAERHSQSQATTAASLLQLRQHNLKDSVVLSSKNLFFSYHLLGSVSQLVNILVNESRGIGGRASVIFVDFEFELILHSAYQYCIPLLAYKSVASDCLELTDAVKCKQLSLFICVRIYSSSLQTFTSTYIFFHLPPSQRDIHSQISILLHGKKIMNMTNSNGLRTQEARLLETANLKSNSTWRSTLSLGTQGKSKALSFSQSKMGTASVSSLL